MRGRFRKRRIRRKIKETRKIVQRKKINSNFLIGTKIYSVFIVLSDEIQNR